VNTVSRYTDNDESSFNATLNALVDAVIDHQPIKSALKEKAQLSPLFIDGRTWY
jgi:hypothetical protein